MLCHVERSRDISNCLTARDSSAALGGVLHVNKVALLLAMFENARPLAGLHLLCKMINHARWHAFVRFARPVNVKVTQADDDPASGLGGSAPGNVVHNDF